MLVGKIVALKSGGPAMTVCAYDRFKELVTCQWFRESELCTGTFREDVLEYRKDEIERSE